MYLIGLAMEELEAPRAPLNDTSNLGSAARRGESNLGKPARRRGKAKSNAAPANRFAYRPQGRPRAKAKPADGRHKAAGAAAKPGRSKRPTSHKSASRTAWTPALIVEVDETAKAADTADTASSRVANSPPATAAPTAQFAAAAAAAAQSAGPRQPTNSASRRSGLRESGLDNRNGTPFPRAHAPARGRRPADGPAVRVRPTWKLQLSPAHTSPPHAGREDVCLLIRDKKLLRCGRLRRRSYSSRA